jgi:uncharacterized protein (TIGR03437 family)
MNCWYLLLGIALGASAQVTTAPAGPFHVSGNRIIDAAGKTFVVRGTRLPVVSLKAGPDFGAFSGTTFATLRQRLNLNAVRVPVDERQYVGDERYRAVVKKTVGLANQLELLVILECSVCARDFVGSPNVFFASGDVEGIRGAGALQPVIVASVRSLTVAVPGQGGFPGALQAQTPSLVGGGGSANLIEERNLSYSAIPADFGSERPLLVNGLDPQLDQAAGECAAFPSDPGAASTLLGNLLNQFDRQSVSWTISSLEPGKLIDGYRAYDWTKLDDGWSCGETPVYSGIGMMLLAHLWHSDPHGLLTVSQPTGGLVIARGAFASAYGRTLADREARGNGTRLANISVRVTDSRGISRLVPISWTGGGWSSLNLIIPPNAATGPAEVAVVRTDGSETVSKIVIADVAPGWWTAPNDGRGAVIANVTQRFLDGKTTQFPAWACDKVACRTLPIPLTPRATTTVRVDGNGFRFTTSKAHLKVFVDGLSVPVESFGPIAGGARDQVTIRMPNDLIGRGEVDLFLIADGALSNVVRINCGKLPADPKSQLGRFLFYDKRMSVNGCR